MSQRRFASITSNLLVRKGEAAPSPIGAGGAGPYVWLADSAAKPAGPAVAADEKVADRFVYSPDETSVVPLHPHDHSEKVRRIVLTLTAHEYETLGLVAVKKNSTRHQLAQEAMNAYFEWLTAEYGEVCACIAGGALCRCECGAPRVS